MTDGILPSARRTCRQLLAEAKAYDYRGYDPYDGLNSTVFVRSPFHRSRLCRIAWTQLHKRLPVNLRHVSGIARQANPKGVALFLSGSLDLGERDGASTEHCLALGRTLKDMAERGFSGACWGYPFPWQGRSFYLPKYTPTVVVTSFVGNALIDLYNATENTEWLDLARSACDFILNDLNVEAGSEGLCFSYSPIDHTRVHNASLLGVALLARVGGLTGEESLLSWAGDGARYSAVQQNKDGSWVYGKDGNQQWVDHFHTGFVLDSLSTCADVLGDGELNACVDRGFRFYRDRMFTNEGRPKYYPDSVYPLDAHSYAQAMLTLSRFGDLASAMRVGGLAMADLGVQGSVFGYQKTRWFLNRVAYLRWSHAWVFRGLASLIRQVQRPDRTNAGRIA